MKTSTERPRLTSTLITLEFCSWYWLKEELVVFCRANGIRSSGSKLELQSRIIDYLSGRPAKPELSATRRAGNMPLHFSLDTVIGEGWRCNPALGAFFRKVCGPGFHFNGAMRDFIHLRAGQTLADAAVCYRVSVGPNAKPRGIPKQLEYNQHFRSYFQLHPNATRQDAIDAWWTLRSGRRTKTG